MTAVLHLVSTLYFYVVFSHAKCLNDRQKVSKYLDHSIFQDVPGQKYGAKKQCEFLLRDTHAVMSPNQKLSDICNNLQCKTPTRSGYYYAGPALEGTDCGRGMVYAANIKKIHLFF